MLKLVFFLLLAGVCDGVVGQNRFLLNEIYDWANMEDAKNYVDRAKKAGFNVLMPVVWHGRGGSWNSKVTDGLPDDPWYAKKISNSKVHDSEAFQYFLDYAHSQGLKVHPYFTVSHNPYGIMKEYSPEGTPESAFNMHEESFRSHFLNLVEEFLEKYEVDGIGLDYIRTKGICKTPSCISNYKKMTGRSLVLDSYIYLHHQEARSAIQLWNTDAVTAFVQGVKVLLDKYQENAELNVMSHASMEILRDQGADSVLWANKGLIDRIFHMEYAELSKIRHSLLNKAFEQIEDDSKIVLMMANYTKSKEGPIPRQVHKVEEVINFARCASGRDGDYALYAYEYFDEDQLDFFESTNAVDFGCQD